MKLSIIVSTLNNSKSLKRTVESILNNQYPAELFELIVVDNASEDDTAEMMKSLIEERVRFNIQYVYEAKEGLLFARNTAVKRSTGEVLLFTDDDVVVDVNWMASYANTFQNEEVHLAGGKNIAVFEGGSVPEWTKNYAHHDNKTGGNYHPFFSALDFGDEEVEISFNFVWGLNFSVRRQTIIDQGGFHPDILPSYLKFYQGDGEVGLGKQIASSGYKILYQPKAIVYHHIPVERITVNQFQRKMQFLGLSTSYSLYRYENEFIQTKKLLRKRRFMYLLGKLKFYLFYRKQEQKRVYYSIWDSYWNAFFEHGEFLKNNPQLLSWIRKEDYLNAEMPLSGKAKRGERHPYK